MFIWTFLVRKFGKGAATLIAGIAALLLILLVFNVVKTLFTAGPEAQSKLNQATTEAAQESGKDAVNTVGVVHGNADKIDEITWSNANEIDKAEGSDAVVADGVRNAGLNSLCNRASYRKQHPECVQ